MTLKQYVLPNILPLILGASFAIAATPVDAKQHRHQEHTKATKHAPETCNSYMIVNLDTGETVDAKDPKTPRTIASMVKVITAIAAIKATEDGRLNMDDTITAPLVWVKNKGHSLHAVTGPGIDPSTTPKAKPITDSLANMLRAILGLSFNQAAQKVTERIEQVSGKPFSDTATALLESLGVVKGQRIIEGAGVSNTSVYRGRPGNMMTAEGLIALVKKARETPLVAKMMGESSIPFQGVDHKPINPFIATPPAGFEPLSAKTGTGDRGERGIFGFGETTTGTSIAFAFQECTSLRPARTTLEKAARTIGNHPKTLAATAAATASAL